MILAPAEQPVSCVMIYDVIRLPRWGKKANINIYGFYKQVAPLGQGGK